MVSLPSLVMELAVLTKEDPQMQEKFTLNDKWTEGSNNLENNGVGGFT